MGDVSMVYPEDDSSIFNRPAGIAFSAKPTPTLIIADKDNHQIQVSFCLIGVGNSVFYFLEQVIMEHIDMKNSLDVKSKCTLHVPLEFALENKFSSEKCVS